MRQHPKDITLEWSIPKRTGKIFMDYNMNVRGKTLNVAYSRAGAGRAGVDAADLGGTGRQRIRWTSERTSPQRLAATGIAGATPLNANKVSQEAFATDAEGRSAGTSTRRQSWLPIDCSLTVSFGLVPFP